MALEALLHGVEYEASVHNPRTGWRRETVKPSRLCTAALRAMSLMLPLASSSSQKGLGVPRRFVEWSARLRGDGAGPCTSSNKPADEQWLSNVQGLAPRREDMLGAYKSWFACGDVASGHGECGEPLCPSCWEDPGQLEGQDLLCHNLYTPSPAADDSRPARVSGADVRRFVSGEDESLWLRETGGDDVEFRRDPKDATRRPMGRVLYFFTHRPNRAPGSPAYDGEPITWAAILEYKSRGPGLNLAFHSSTPLPLFTLNQTVLFYPAREMTRIVHMAHACTPQGAHPCKMREENGNPVWIHSWKGSNARIFMRNEHSGRSLP